MPRCSPQDDATDPAQTNAVPRRAVKLLVTRVQQVAPVRPTVGVMMDGGCTFTDVLVKALTFGQSPMAEADVVRAAEPYTRIRLSVVVCAWVRLMPSACWRAAGSM